MGCGEIVRILGTLAGRGYFWEENGKLGNDAPAPQSLAWTLWHLQDSGPDGQPHLGP